MESMNQPTAWCIANYSASRINSNNGSDRNVSELLGTDLELEETEVKLC